MKLDDLLLTKDEIPVRHLTSFFVPIHPLLLKPPHGLSPTLAQEAFPQAEQEWKIELTAYASGLPSGEERTWIEEVFLGKKSPRSDPEFPFLTPPPFTFNVKTLADENGFVQHLSIGRNTGNLHFTGEETAYLPAWTLLSPEKILAYQCNASGEAYAYQHDNIEHRPSALLMRNWALLYVNAALRQVLHD